MKLSKLLTIEKVLAYSEKDKKLIEFFEECDEVLEVVFKSIKEEVDKEFPSDYILVNFNCDLEVKEYCVETLRDSLGFIVQPMLEQEDGELLDILNELRQEEDKLSRVAVGDFYYQHCKFSVCWGEERERYN